jgi:predicted nucleic acid-binding Zn ribbon protein
MMALRERQEYTPAHRNLHSLGQDANPSISRDASRSIVAERPRTSEWDIATTSRRSHSQKFDYPALVRCGAPICGA